MIKILSLDFNGTLAEVHGLDWFWREEIPRLYAQRAPLELVRAKDIVLEEYNRIGPQRSEWYDPHFWFKRYGIEEDFTVANMELVKITELYPDVMGFTLPVGIKLIICSRAWPELIRPVLEKAGLKPEAIFSPSVFGFAKKDSNFYLRVSKIIGEDASCFLHVGDSPEYDLAEPTKAGWFALLMDRSNKFPNIKNRVTAFGNLTHYLA
jgi:putative hydrolase of the HAD superfamily